MERALWLRERVRQGELDQDRVRLAAYCGDAAAGELLGPGSLDALFGTVGMCSLWAWAPGLVRYGREVAVRAVVAAARLAVDRRTRRWTVRALGSVYATRREALAAAIANGVLGPVVEIHAQPRTLPALRAAEAWLCCPCAEHEEACASAIDHALGGAGDMATWAYACCWLVARLDEQGDEDRVLAAALGSVAVLVGQRATRDAVSEALVEWSCGTATGERGG